MKWYIALNESGTRGDIGLHAKLAVLSAKRHTDLQPVLLYTGERNASTVWFENHGVKIVDSVLPYLSTILDLSAQNKYNTKTVGHWLRTNVCLTEMEDEYALYTDIDIIFRSQPNFEGLSPKYFCAAPEKKKNIWNYFNAGVMLLNCPGMRSDYDDFEKYLIENIREKTYSFHDQIAYNIFYRNRWEKLPVGLNWKPYWGPNADACILHYHGAKAGAIAAILENHWNWETDHGREIGSMFVAHYNDYVTAFEELAPYAGDLPAADAQLLNRVLDKIHAYDVGEHSPKIDMSFLDFRMFDDDQFEPDLDMVGSISDVSESPQPLNVLGYNSIGGGGINNQIMALIGLFVTALESGNPLSLPDFTLMDQVNRAYDRLDFDTIFRKQPFLDVAGEFNIKIIQVVPEELPNGYDNYFWKTYGLFENKISYEKYGIDQVNDLILSLLSAFEPAVKKSFLFDKLRYDIFVQEEVEIAAQFRIEFDWKQHCHGNLEASVKNPEDNYIPASKIVEKILAKFPETKKIYVICDEPALLENKYELKDQIQSTYGITLLFKSDFLSSFEAGLLRATHLSLLDFELAREAKIFVGLSRSTFSNMVALQSYARSKTTLENQYIYNSVLPIIMKRTDNGCHTDAIQAINTNNSTISMRDWQANQDTAIARYEGKAVSAICAEKIEIGQFAILRARQLSRCSEYIFCTQPVLNGLELSDGLWVINEFAWESLD